MAGKPRSKFLEAADAWSPTRLQRLERFVFRQRPLKTGGAFSAQSADPRAFDPTEEGSGNFGRWIIDGAGLPAYQYEMDQHNDPRAVYPNTEGIERRDHWHQVGNRRVTAMASNDGTVQVYLADRGGVILNRFEASEHESIGSFIRRLLYKIGRAIIMLITRLAGKAPEPLVPFSAHEYQAAMAGADPKAAPRGRITPDIEARFGATSGQQVSAQSAPAASGAPDAEKTSAYAGGFGYIDDGREVWSTAYRYRPGGARTRRVFGIGYMETETTYRDIRATRRVYAPFGDHPLVLADIELENLGAQPVTLRHYEYWDVNVHQLQLEWLRSSTFARLSDRARRDVNKFFRPSVRWMSAEAALRFKQKLVEPAPAQAKGPDEPSDIDWHPANIVLADLSGVPDAFYVDKHAFFGRGGARRPDAISERRAGDTVDTVVPNDTMPYCLVLRRDLTLQPGERRTLRYGFGTVRQEAALDFLEPFRLPADHLAQTLAKWKESLAYFKTGEDAVLHREMAWHAYYLLSATVYLDFYRAHVVPQGSAYLYLHGADGAPRDQALFVLSTVYFDPPLARDMLRLIMQVTHAHTGQINYAFGGHGFLSTGLDLHNKPSDLDLFFLLAMAEYLSATGDYAFLDEQVPYYPPQESPAGATVLDHVRQAVTHLFEKNGIGEHGLIKVGSGDWSDSIVLESAVRDGPGPFGVTYANSKENGESVPNTQMALYVLPLIAEVLKDRDPLLKEYIYDTPSQPDRLARLRDAVHLQWNPKGWYNRAVLRNVFNDARVIEYFSLEAQVWALISADGSEERTTAALIEKVDQYLDRPSPIGASLVMGGMTWPAVSQLLTWGYMRTGRPQLAWRALNRHTYAAHSTAYPDIWINTWSGPDGVNGRDSDLPGGTWSSFVTPMTDFPIMNANQDAMMLMGLMRVCGIEPAATGDGLLIRPQVPRNGFILETPLLRLDVSPTRLMLRYNAANDGERTFYIRHIAENVVVRVDGSDLTAVEIVDGQVVVPVRFVKGQSVTVEVAAR